MSNRRRTIAVTFAFATLAGIWVQQASAEEPGGFKRVELKRRDIAAAKTYEAVLGRAELQGGIAAPWHTHPGDEMGYVLQGDVLVEMDGQPPMTMKPGDSFFVPAGTVHHAKNTGKTEAKIVSTYIIEKGKPLATPAAAPGSAAPAKK
jgi:quercetin dioxygenase-like cupin family protein